MFLLILGREVGSLLGRDIRSSINRANLSGGLLLGRERFLLSRGVCYDWLCGWSYPCVSVGSVGVPLPVYLSLL